MQAAGPNLEQLLIRVSDQDRAAFRALYDHSSAQVFAVLLRILPRRDIAEEALQDVFVRVWREATSYRESRGKALSWMTTIARNRALDIRRRLGRELQMDDATAESLAQTESTENDPALAAQWGSEAAVLNSCLGELNDEQRGSIRLAFFQGLSYSEVATAIGAPLGTVKSWIRRGLAALKMCVER